MSYGVLIVLTVSEEGREALPEPVPGPGQGPDLTPGEAAMRDALNEIERQAGAVVKAFGGRTLVAYTPRAQPSIEHVNIWIDREEFTLAEAIQRAGECAAALEQAGLSIVEVQQFNWEHTVILA